MSQKPRLVSGRRAVQKFQKVGWTLVRRRGSHMMLTHPEYRWTLSVPDHRELGFGMLRKLIKQAGMTVERFNAL